MKPIKIIIVDDKKVFREGLQSFFKNTNIVVIGQANTGVEAISLLHRLHPDLVLLDLNMPEMDGNVAFTKIRFRFPGVKVLILSAFFERFLKEDYCQRGAWGYLPKEAMSKIENDQFLITKAINSIGSGEKFFYDKYDSELKLSTVQRQILPHLFDGQTNLAISKKVKVTERTIERQRQKIYSKVGAVEAIGFFKFAFSRGWQFLSNKTH